MRYIQHYRKPIFSDCLKGENRKNCDGGFETNIKRIEINQRATCKNLGIKNRFQKVLPENKIAFRKLVSTFNEMDHVKHDSENFARWDHYCLVKIWHWNILMNIFSQRINTLEKFARTLLNDWHLKEIWCEMLIVINQL